MGLVVADRVYGIGGGIGIHDLHTVGLYFPTVNHTLYFTILDDIKLAKIVD